MSHCWFDWTFSSMYDGIFLNQLKSSLKCPIYRNGSIPESHFSAGVIKQYQWYLPVLEKLIEQLVYEQIYTLCENNNIFNLYNSALDGENKLLIL